ncbi:MAG: hypothetical protein LYZ66_07110 [Nitrososphaerales archaeon]|nr:hypothetical protein [Nitrososphaerales archaeon]
MAKGLWERLAADDLDRVESVDAQKSGTRDESKMTKRSRLERYIDILRVVSESGPMRRTHILYRANLAWGDLEDSLGRLEEAGALRKVISTSGVFYEITDSGKRFLSNFVNIKESLELGLLAKDNDPHRLGR